MYILGFSVLPFGEPSFNTKIRNSNYKNFCLF